MDDMVVKNGQGQAIDSPLAGDLIAEGHTMEQIKTPFHTAVRVQKARAPLATICAKVEEEALISGEEFYYGWGAGGNRIEGPSIKLANAVARVYGNCVVMPMPIQETRDAWIFTSSFIDLETGYTNMRQFRQSKKWVVHGKFDAERKDDIRFQIGQSKANRNTVINSVPPILIKKAMDMAKQGVREKIVAYIAKNGLKSAVAIIEKEFLKVGVKKASLESKYSKKLDKWDVELIVLAKGDLQAIQDGVESADNLFSDMKQPEVKPETTVGLKKTKKEVQVDKKTVEPPLTSEAKEPVKITPKVEPVKKEEPVKITPKVTTPAKKKPTPLQEKAELKKKYEKFRDASIMILIEKDVAPNTLAEVAEVEIGRRITELDEKISADDMEKIYNGLVQRYGAQDQELMV